MSNRKISLNVTTGIVAINTALMLFVMDFLKDKEVNDSIRYDWCFNSGIAICLFCLPVLAFLCYLLGMIDESSTNEKFENKVKIVILVAVAFWVIDCIGILMLQNPFYAFGISFMSITSVGFIVGGIVFLILNLYLRGSDKSQNNALPTTAAKS